MNTPSFSAKIDISLKDKLIEDLGNQGFTFTHPPYTVFAAKKKGVTCTLYTSGALVVQGKEKKEFIEFYLEPEILHKFTFLYPETSLDLTPRMGIDEAGKGDFFGALCIGGVYADAEGIKKLHKAGVKDSKLMQDASIIKMAKVIKETCHFHIIRLFPEKYNELYAKFKNLNRLLAWGHATVIENLYQKTSCQYAVIDQFADERVVDWALSKKNIPVRLEQRHKGEQDVVVAAASILARNAFLESLKDLEEKFSLTLPKGAGTQVNKAGGEILQKSGIDTLNKVSKTHFKTYKEIVGK